MAKKYVFQIRDFEEHSENPFLEILNVPLAPKTHTFVSKDKAIINTNTGEMDDDTIITGKTKFVDGEHFVKIFVKEMEAIFELSKAAQKVFSYMLLKVGYDDRLIFDIEECLERTGYVSKPPIFAGIGELLKNSFIAKTRNQFVYWINPRLFYKGDRLVVMREYRKAKQSKIPKNQLDLFDEHVEEVKNLGERIDQQTQSKALQGKG